MTHNSCLPCLDVPIDFPFSYDRLVSHKRNIYAQALAQPYPKQHACQLRAPTLPAHLLSSSPRSSLYLSFSRIRINTRCGCLDYILGLINSWCSAPRLLLVLTQTATNW
ncbi:unnamed protein product [Hymenolepis diminuta]|uniref:Uncharacterized protein n=1 Tax=Hymenolepis diminuta TaxID=6216 RepID=A0A564YUJ0_HYMDI|nr:unnamed protein product [Hymenolepis diminuta]